MVEWLIYLNEEESKGIYQDLSKNRKIVCKLTDHLVEIWLQYAISILQSAQRKPYHNSISFGWIKIYSIDKIELFIKRHIQDQLYTNSKKKQLIKIYFSWLILQSELNFRCCLEKQSTILKI